MLILVQVSDEQVLELDGEPDIDLWVQGLVDAEITRLANDPWRLHVRDHLNPGRPCPSGCTYCAEVAP
jgi:hypothetical protein